MAKEAPPIGSKVEGTVLSVNGECTLGYQVGDKFDLSVHKTDGLCGFFYHHCFPSIMTLQLGGGFPMGEDKDVMMMVCPHAGIDVTLELRRVK